MICYCLIHFCLCFNPRARTGRDHSLSFYAGIYSRFNPRARTGRDRQEARLRL